MKTANKGIIMATVTSLAILTGCSTMQTAQTIDQTDPVVKALRAAPEIRELPNIDLSKYKRIEFVVIEDPENGQKLIAMSPDDFELMTELLNIAANRIKLQRLTLQEVRQFFDERLRRSEMGGSDQD